MLWRENYKTKTELITGEPGALIFYRFWTNEPASNADSSAACTVSCSDTNKIRLFADRENAFPLRFPFFFEAGHFRVPYVDGGAGTERLPKPVRQSRRSCRARITAAAAAAATENGRLYYDCK